MFEDLNRELAHRATGDLVAILQQSPHDLALITSGADGEDGYVVLKRENKNDLRCYIDINWLEDWETAGNRERNNMESALAKTIRTLSEDSRVRVDLSKDDIGYK